MNETDISKSLAETVREAAARNTALAIRGAGTKRFYTGELAGAPLDVTAHRGIVSYEPTELVMTARAGTPLTEIEAALAARDQMLGFEPPHFGPSATLGGALACGLSGPRRPYAGSARDFVLGTRIVNGRGEILRFGGQVMKNVAGFDVARLLVGSLGTLGVILEASLKVLPRPPQENTLVFELGAAEAIARMNSWAGQPLPLSAAAHSGESLYIRLSGSDTAVRAARAKLGGELLERGAAFWEDLREHRRAFFRDPQPLWRLSLPAAAAPLDLPGKWLIDWGGAQRWLKTDLPARDVETAAARNGGYAQLFSRVAVPGHLPAALQRLNVAVKSAMDPAGILNTAVAA